jgi:hypothetical protein
MLLLLGLLGLYMQTRLRMDKGRCDARDGRARARPRKAAPCDSISCQSQSMHTRRSQCCKGACKWNSGALLGQHAWRLRLEKYCVGCWQRHRLLENTYITSYV